MVRLATTHPEKRGKQAALSQLTPVKSEHLSGIDAHLREMRFKLAYDLQTSLEIQTLLERFFGNTQDFVITHGMFYRNEALGLDASVGESTTHSIAYTLTVEDTALGELKFFRRKKFSETELAVLEMLIGVLFYPLRNAILYRQAVDSSLLDKLTGVGNRAAMELAFEREIKLAARHNEAMAVLVIDVDHFKRINDSVGHVSGDQALKQVAKSIKQTLRETDQVFRYGGEEFIALLQNSGAHEAHMIAERIRVNTAMSPISLDNENLFCTVSIGASIFSGKESAQQLIEHADAALYRAKNLGRNRVEVWLNSAGEALDEIKTA